jgi:uncharacterized protein (TIGR00730 family)
MTEASRRIQSVCLYCGSSDAADPVYLENAAELGRALAQSGVRLVYGGGGVGLMGAAARAAAGAGGRVLGVMPEFLRRREILYDEVETVVVRSMHERKLLMFEESDAFAVLPGGIGTLEEVVELLSWRRLDLHAKPIVFVDVKGYWKPFFTLIEHTIREKLTPPGFAQSWITVERADQVLPALLGRAAA